jgi:molecular chaperone DnaJ
LSDTKKREAYDQFGFAGQNFGGGGGAGGFSGDPFGPGGPFAGGGFRSGGAGNAGGENFQDIFGDMFGDIFGARPGGGGGPRAQRRPAKGADLRYSLSITLEESAVGTEKTIHFARQNKNKEENRKLTVTVPAGVREGQRLKLSGEGDITTGGAGDLFVIINLQEHPLFRRQDYDVLLDLPVSYINAILGTSIEVPTLTGKSEIRIPPGTHTGQNLRLKGKGFPKSGGYGNGDMLIRVLVDTPENISGKQKEHLEELAKLADDTPLVKSFKDKTAHLLRNRK